MTLQLVISSLKVPERLESLRFHALPNSSSLFAHEIPSRPTVKPGLFDPQRVKTPWFRQGRPEKWPEIPLGLPSKDPTSKAFRVPLVHPKNVSDLGCFEGHPTQNSGLFAGGPAPKGSRFGACRAEMTTSRVGGDQISAARGIGDSLITTTRHIWVKEGRNTKNEEGGSPSSLLETTIIRLGTYTVCKQAERAPL